MLGFAALGEKALADAGVGSTSDATGFQLLNIGTPTASQVGGGGGGTPAVYTWNWIANPVSSKGLHPGTPGEDKVPVLLRADTARYTVDGPAYNALTSQGAFTASGNWLPPAYNGSRWVTVRPGGAGTNDLAYSDDGITWTVTSFPLGVSATWASIVWSPTLNKFMVHNNGSTVFVSNDSSGTTWTGSAGNVSWSGSGGTGYLRGIWSATLGKFVVPRIGTAFYVSSADGVTWTTHTHPSETSIQAMADNGSVLVSLGGRAATDTIKTTPDNSTWTTRATSSNFRGASLSYDGSNFFAAGGIGNEPSDTKPLKRSADGITWTNETLPAGGDSFSIYNLSKAADGVVVFTAGEAFTAPYLLVGYAASGPPPQTAQATGTLLLNIGIPTTVQTEPIPPRTFQAYGARMLYLGTPATPTERVFQAQGFRMLRMAPWIVPMVYEERRRRRTFRAVGQLLLRIGTPTSS